MAKPLEERIKALMVANDLKAGMTKGKVVSRYGFLGTVEVLERALLHWEREGYIKRPDYTPNPPAEKQK